MLAEVRRVFEFTIVRCCFVLLLFASSKLSALQPEDVLGEYWTDPLFGVASAEKSQRVEVLYQLLFPEVIEVFTGQTTRFVFENNSDQIHVFLFSAGPDDVQNDDDFKSFVSDELHHASQEIASNDGHVHSSAESDDAKPLVGMLSDRPTMTLQPHDKREIILSFDEPATVILRCVLDGHEELGHQSIINVVDSGFLLDEKE